MKKNRIIPAIGLFLAFCAAPAAQAASYGHYHGFRYCTQSACAPASFTRGTAASTAAVPTAASAPAAVSAPAPVGESGREMLALVNEDRAAQGLAPLQWSDSLAQAALSHSRDMAENGFFSHTSPTYGGFSARLKASGIATLGAGENLALYSSLEKAEAALMSSSGHRANLLNSRYTHCGIGIVYSAKKGGYYITQWFARMS